MNPGTSAAPKKKILVVDDNEVVLKTVSLKLQGCGYQVITALDGTEAVASARIVITGLEDIKNKERATSSGAVAFFHKPINHDDLLKVVRATLEDSGKPA